MASGEEAAPLSSLVERLLRRLGTTCSRRASCGGGQRERKARMEASLQAEVLAAAAGQPLESFRTASEENILLWLRFCSWTLCATCGRKRPRSLSQAELVDPQRARDAMQHCCGPAAEVPAEVPLPERVPQALRDLPWEVVLALRPLTLHQGTPAKHPHGYRRKDQMTGLSWSAVSVEDAVAALPAALRGAGLAARAWLMQHCPPYSAWSEYHAAALREGRQRRLYPSAILEPFLEVALWPHLYWNEALCESRVWAPDGWRAPFAAHQGKRRGGNFDSAKAAFIEKVTGAVVDYAASYELLQFQFDRFVLRTVYHGAAAVADRDCNSAASLEHRHWTRGYWQRQHNVLMDIVHQHGVPDLFLTISPYEWYFPFPYWVEKAHALLGRGPTECSAAETLAIAHAVRQIVGGLLGGSTTDASRWRDHVFSCKTAAAQIPCIHFGRFEFQEKGQQQEYGKGRGSIHCHVLFWLPGIRTRLLEQAICAEVPAQDPELAVLARHVQRGWQPCRAPVQEEASRWTWCADSLRWVLHLRHPASFAKDLRPFLRPVLRLLRCAQDVQWWHGSAALLRYVSGYVVKHAESWQDSWMECDDAFQSGLRVCRAWKPCEAEMVMTLARGGMTMTNVASKHYRPPTFSAGEDDALRLYRRRPSAVEARSFLDWLRTHTVALDAHGVATARARASRTPVAVGVSYSRKFPHDDFFWQWVVMHVPHRIFHELLPEDSWCVSPQHRGFACAWLLCPQQWGNDAWIQEWLELEGNKIEWVRTRTHQLRSCRELLRKQIAGELPRGNAPATLVTRACMDLSLEQADFVSGCLSDLAARRDAAEDPATVEAMCRVWQPRVLTGGPGSGKSYCVSALVDEAHRIGYSAVVMNPTGRLTSNARRPAGIQALTLARALGQRATGDFGEPSPGLDVDLWILGEIGMVDLGSFERLMRVWQEKLRLPLLVMEGDFAQLPPVTRTDGEDARSSRLWKAGWLRVLNTQYRCSDAELLQFQVSVRSWRPPDDLVRAFFKDVIVGDDVTEASLWAAWAVLPEAKVLVARRSTADFVNDTALNGIGGDWLAQVPLWDTTSTGESYVRWQWLREGCAIMLTANVDVDLGLTNGAEGKVLSASAHGIVVDFGTCIHSIHLRSAWVGRGEDEQLRAAFDACLAYAMTVHKAEGTRTYDVGVTYIGS